VKRRKLGLIEEDNKLAIDNLDETKMREIVSIMIKDEIRKKQQETQRRVNPEFGNRAVIPESDIDTLMMMETTENSEKSQTPSTGTMGDTIGGIYEEIFGGTTKGTLGGTLALGARLIPDQGVDSLTEEIMEEIKRRTENKTSTVAPSSSLGDTVAPDSGLPTPGVIIGVPIETQTGGQPPPPQVSVEELPSDSPGCRTLATKTCYKIPVIINKKVPFETCRSVPDVECHTILRPVPDVECVPEPYLQCNDIAVDIPFLEPAEECEEIVFDECLEIQEKIPVELCSRKRVDEESFFLERGKVFRKEGEKRRRKVGKKKGKQEEEQEEQNSGEDL